MGSWWGKTPCKRFLTKLAVPRELVVRSGKVLSELKGSIEEALRAESGFSLDTKERGLFKEVLSAQADLHFLYPPPEVHYTRPVEMPRGITSH